MVIFEHNQHKVGDYHNGVSTTTTFRPHGIEHGHDVFRVHVSSKDGYVSDEAGHDVDVRYDGRNDCLDYWLILPSSSTSIDV